MKISIKQKVKAFTLIEVLVAASVFATVGLLSLLVFVNVLKIQTRVDLENALYEDGRFMMERLTREIKNNAIDYEEYFNKNFKTSGNKNTYGKIYGCYSSQFYNPGVTTSGASDTLGALCGNPTTELSTSPNCKAIFKPSLDINTGVNPYTGRSGFVSSDVSAFCAKSSSPFNDTNRQCAGITTFNPQEELYLIDEMGKEKTFFARKRIRIASGSNPDEYALSTIKLSGEDSNTDAITDKWQNVGGTLYFDYNLQL